MSAQHRVIEVTRGGFDPAGGDWEKFKTAQEQVLDAAAREGWHLVQVVPVTHGGAAATGITLRSVLLYLVRDP
jgi:hypothetical protein